MNWLYKSAWADWNIKEETEDIAVIEWMCDCPLCGALIGGDIAMKKPINDSWYSEYDCDECFDTFYLHFE